MVIGWRGNREVWLNLRVEIVSKTCGQERLQRFKEGLAGFLLNLCIYIALSA